MSSIVSLLLMTAVYFVVELWKKVTPSSWHRFTPLFSVVCGLGLSLLLIPTGVVWSSALLQGLVCGCATVVCYDLVKGIVEKR